MAAFEGQVSLGVDDLGRYVRKSVYGLTRAEVIDKLAALRLNFEQAPKRQGTIAELLERWLVEKIEPRRRPNTFRQYDYICRLWIVPFVGAYRVEQFSVRDVEHVLSAVKKGRINKKKELVPGTPRILKLVHVTLHVAFRQAIRWGMVDRNPVDNVDAPVYEAPERVPLNFEQSERLRDAAFGHRFYAAILLPLATGIRPGEVFGLLWKHIDFKREKLTIEHTLVSAKGLGHPTLGAPKSKHSYREVDLPQVAIEALQERRLLRIQEGHAASPYVFCDVNGAPVRESNFRRDVWLPLLVKAGLASASIAPRKKGQRISKARRLCVTETYHFHDLRHTFATNEVAEGRDLYALRIQNGARLDRHDDPHVCPPERQTPESHRRSHSGSAQPENQGVIAVNRSGTSCV